MFGFFIGKRFTDDAAVSPQNRRIPSPNTHVVGNLRTYGVNLLD